MKRFVAGAGDRDTSVIVRRTRRRTTNQVGVLAGGVQAPCTNQQVFKWVLVKQWFGGQTVVANGLRLVSTCAAALPPPAAGASQASAAVSSLRAAEHTEVRCGRMPLATGCNARCMLLSTQVVSLGC